MRILSENTLYTYVLFSLFFFLKLFLGRVANSQSSTVFNIVFVGRCKLVNFPKLPFATQNLVIQLSDQELLQKLINSLHVTSRLVAKHWEDFGEHLLCIYKLAGQFHSLTHNSDKRVHQYPVTLAIFPGYSKQKKQKGEIFSPVSISSACRDKKKQT